MARRQLTWVYKPSKSFRPKVSNSVKADVEQKARRLVETVQKPRCIEPPPKKQQFNYIVDIYTKWRGSYFYFCAKYRSPGPRALSPFFEIKFARLRFVSNDVFNLAYMRHTGQWVEVFKELSLDECLTAVKDEPLFHP